MKVPLKRGEDPCAKYWCERSLREAGYPIERGVDPCKRWKTIQGGYPALYDALGPYWQKYTETITLPIMGSSVHFLNEVKTHPERWASKKEELYDKLAEIADEIREDAIMNENYHGKDFFLWNVFHKPEWREVISNLPDEDEILMKNKEYRPYKYRTPSLSRSQSKSSSRSNSGGRENELALLASIPSYRH